MEGGEIHGNSSALDAGGLLIGAGATVTLTSVDITENVAMARGGGFFVENGTLNIDGGFLLDNTAWADANTRGGAVSMANGTLNFINPWLFPDPWKNV
jgi:hypothetical protein